jgi:predicted nucleotidyltransferase
LRIGITLLEGQDEFMVKETKEKQPVTREEIEARRREALAVAEQCARMLKERFGARQVTPFGSLLDDGSWHESSDLDLAVEGLSSEALWEAERQLEAMSPPWLEVDLVPLERAYPEVRGRILRERPVPEDPHLALKARLEDELVGLERIARGLEVALERAGAGPDEFATRALASYLDDFYKGCERICERVAVTLDGGPSASLRTGLPQGEGWHRVLLGQMGEPGGGGRPSLFSSSLLLELDEYRRFRHRVRHIYGYELEAERVLALARGVKPVLARVRQALEVFSEWLEHQASA